jgi:hypothetical protein
VFLLAETPGLHIPRWDADPQPPHHKQSQQPQQHSQQQPSHHQQQQNHHNDHRLSSSPSSSSSPRRQRRAHDPGATQYVASPAAERARVAAEAAEIRQREMIESVERAERSLRTLMAAADREPTITSIPLSPPSLSRDSLSHRGHLHASSPAHHPNPLRRKSAPVIDTMPLGADPLRMRSRGRNYGARGRESPLSGDLLRTRQAGPAGINHAGPAATLAAVDRSPPPRPTDPLGMIAASGLQVRWNPLPPSSPIVRVIAPAGRARSEGPPIFRDGPPRMGQLPFGGGY